MDRELRESRRDGDPLRTAHLLRRSGRTAEALAALADVWLTGAGPSRALAEAGLSALLDAAPAGERLALAPGLERLGGAGLAGADARLDAWFPVARDLVGGSPAARQLRAFVYEQARASGPVVLWGEPGVGRALAARTLHRLSGRRGFHEAYAPQGTARLAGELAEHTPAGGTLYVSYADPRDAGRWLGLVLDACARQDARLVVGATAEPLLEPLVTYPTRRVAPLRERFEDLPRLVEALLHRAGAAEAARAVDDKLITMLRWHDWPGNIRELANHVARAVINGDERPSEIADQLVQGLFGLPGEVAHELA